MSTRDEEEARLGHKYATTILHQWRQFMLLHNWPDDPGSRALGDRRRMFLQGVATALAILKATPEPGRDAALDRLKDELMGLLRAEDAGAETGK